VPQLSYFMSCLTRYMFKATHAHHTYSKVVLRYFIGIKKRQLTWCGQRVSLPHVLGEILAFVDSSWADDKNNRRSSMTYYLFVNNATFFHDVLPSRRSSLKTPPKPSLWRWPVAVVKSYGCVTLLSSLVFRNSPPLFTRTTLVVSLLLITCIFVVAVSTLLCEYALFRNSFRTD